MHNRDYYNLRIEQETARPGMTLEEVAKELGVPRSVVWHIERRALIKLQALPEAALLLAYVSFHPQHTKRPPRSVEKAGG
jgi:DNA-directed RNA polymerase sigma subunit (sigma70/sigma32)